MTQHCVAKLLITTNPALLTHAQRIGSIKPLINLVKEGESTELQRFEALLSVTNIASFDEEMKSKIVDGNGISVFSSAMFSDHPMVRRAATEALSNLWPHPNLITYMKDPEHLRLLVAFAIDFEENAECSKAATGCLAMLSSDNEVSYTLCKCQHFGEMVRLLLECGNLEIMHRVFVLLINLMEHGPFCREAIVHTGAPTFCKLYIQRYRDGNEAQLIGMDKNDYSTLMLTIDMAKEIVSAIG